MSITIETPEQTEDSIQQEAESQTSQPSQGWGLKIALILSLVLSVAALGGLAYLTSSYIATVNKQERFEKSFGEVREKIQLLEFELKNLQKDFPQVGTDLKAFKIQHEEITRKISQLELSLGSQMTGLQNELKAQKTELAAAQKEIQRVDGYFRT